MHLASGRWLRMIRQVVGWNVSVLDWQSHTSTEMLDVLERRVGRGSIVLLHDQLFMFAATDHPDREAMLEALQAFLSRSPLRCITVPELLASGRPQFAINFKRSEPGWLHNLRSCEGLRSSRDEVSAG